MGRDAATQDEGRGKGAGAGVLCALAAMLIWGLVPVGTRYFVRGVDPLQFNIIRYTAAGLAALPLAWRARPWRWPAGDLGRLAVAGACAIPGYNIPAALAARSVSAGAMGVLIATEPLFILLFTLAAQRIAPRRRVAVGAVAAFSGAALTALAGGSATAAIDPAGAALVLFGSAAWALYAVIAAPLSGRYGAAGVTGAVLVVGGLLLDGGSLAALRATAWPGAIVTGEVAAMGLASALLGFLFWNQAATRMPTARLGLYLYLIPLVSLAGGAAMLGEGLSAGALAGGALILFGVALGEGRLGRGA